MTFRQTMLTCLLVAGLSLTAASANGAIIRLRSVATVDKALINLGDVADVFDDHPQTAESLRSIALRTSPIPGTTTRLNLDQIRERLLGFNIALGNLEFQGSSVAVVTRKGQLLGASATTRTTLAQPLERASEPKPFRRTELAQQVSATTRTVSSLRNISTADIRLAETVVHDLVRDYLAEWAPEWGTPIIRPLLVVPTVPVILSARSGNLEIVSGKPLEDGVFMLEIAVPTGEVTTVLTTPDSTTSTAAKKKIVRVRVRVTRRPKVLIARRIIPQGQLVREADLEWKEVDDLRNGTAEPELVVGMEARRTIREGDFVKAGSVKPPTLIERDELVKVTVRYGSIQVTRTLKARRAGILNDIIELVPVEGTDRTPLLVRVTGKGQAEPLDSESDTTESDSQQIRLTLSNR